MSKETGLELIKLARKRGFVSDTIDVTLIKDPTHDPTYFLFLAEVLIWLIGKNANDMGAILGLEGIVEGLLKNK